MVCESEVDKVEEVDEAQAVDENRGPGKMSKTSYVNPHWNCISIK